MRFRLRALDRMLFPGRLAALRVVLGAFLVFNGLVRVGLAVFDGNVAAFAPWRILPALAIGALFDAGVATFVLAPLAALLWAWPARLEGALRWAFPALLLPLAAVLALVGAAEFVFWNEFASRFNFIAVDYLVYTNEVIGNIRESYDLPVLLGAVALVALAVWLPVARAAGRALAASADASASQAAAADAAGPSPRRTRAVAALLWMATPALSYGALDARLQEFSTDPELNELAGDGYFDFCHAFWENAIDYDRFYRVLPRARAADALAQALGPGAGAGERPFERVIAPHRPERRLNVVLVCVESLSAEFLGAFGNPAGLTPNLDRIAREGLLFTRVYATGTRTVRGLEALTLSVPPTPGHSIVKRPDNRGLFTLGGVFADRGYEPIFLYGGYGYFDNMNAFFGGNGYTVVDRTALSGGSVHHENVWGVADEDLFDLTLRELDRRHAEGRRFFAHVMTTSNHRPFTYPDGRIDIPSRTGREGGVKYTDWAIGRFFEEARARPWFEDTLFVVVADHTHRGRGRLDLPLETFHVPLVVYAPRHVAPGRVDQIMSQIDVGPTLLGLLGFGYRSKFFGRDVLEEGAGPGRALLANYQTVGLYEDGAVVELKPKRRWRLVGATSGEDRPIDGAGQRLLDEATGYYQVASEAYASGALGR